MGGAAVLDTAAPVAAALDTAARVALAASRGPSRRRRPYPSPPGPLQYLGFLGETVPSFARTSTTSATLERS